MRQSQAICMHRPDASLVPDFDLKSNFKSEGNVNVTQYIQLLCSLNIFHRFWERKNLQRHAQQYEDSWERRYDVIE